MGYYVDLVHRHAKKWGESLCWMKINIGYYRCHLRGITKDARLPKDFYKEDINLFDDLEQRLNNFSATEIRLFESVSEMQLRGFFIGYDEIKKHAKRMPDCVNAWFTDYDALLKQREAAPEEYRCDKDLKMLMQGVGAELLTAWGKVMDEIEAYLKIMEEKYQEFGDAYHEMMDNLSAWDDD